MSEQKSRDLLSARINRLFAAERWQDARKLLERELASSCDDHWLFARLSTTFYEQREYKEALSWIRKAHRLAPNCPLVLWELAGALDATENSKKAIAIYKKLLAKGIDEVANDECGEGEAWSQSLLLDCLYRLGGCYEDLGQWKKAVGCYRRYLSVRTLGVRSIYAAADAEARIAEIIDRHPASIGPVIEHELRQASLSV